MPADVTTVPVVDVEPGSVLLAWSRDSVDPLVDAFVSVTRKTLADFAGDEGETAGSR